MAVTAAVRDSRPAGLVPAAGQVTRAGSARSPA